MPVHRGFQKSCFIGSVVFGALKQGMLSSNLPSTQTLGPQGLQYPKKHLLSGALWIDTCSALACCTNQGITETWPVCRPNLLTLKGRLRQSFERRRSASTTADKGEPQDPLLASDPDSPGSPQYQLPGRDA